MSKDKILLQIVIQDRNYIFLKYPPTSNQHFMYYKYEIPLKCYKYTDPIKLLQERTSGIKENQVEIYRN